ncbi:MAG: DUF3307 domain-containing protein [Saprospiraceae bacterium]|nr:DUF3307 domain-containing protein [Saprospiraceae bacterium]
MITLLLQLLIAHLLGDFVFLPSSWQAKRKELGFGSIFTFLHPLIHSALIIILLRDGQYWTIYLAVYISHLLFPFVRMFLERQLNPRWGFGLEQLLHGCMIGWMTSWFHVLNSDCHILYSTETLLFILAILLLSTVSREVMKLWMSKWTMEEDDQSHSLKEAGATIGVLERLFVFGFIILNQWQAIGLLIAAKSVFRFGDLSRARDRKLTEYILIGTMLSFGLAILVGVFYLKVTHDLDLSQQRK